MKSDILTIVASVLVALLALSGLGLYLYFALAADHSIDVWADNQQKQYEIDKRKCEQKGGIAFQSAWDGSLKDCKFPPR